MSDVADFTLVILWQEELIAAAKALGHLHRVEKDDSHTDEQRGNAIFDALNASWAALHSLDTMPKDSPVVLSSTGYRIGWKIGKKKQDRAGTTGEGR